MRRVVAHVFVEDLARPALEDRDVHHFSHVLRLRAGEAVSASDGRGGTRMCQWAGTAQLSPVGEVAYEARPVPSLTVAFSLTKGDHPEWAVQKLTEAGVDRVIVMTTERGVVRWAPASCARQLQRLREVARQAAMQSRRAWLPAVDGPAPFSAVVAGAGGGHDGAPARGGPSLALGPGSAAAGPGPGPAAAGPGSAATGPGLGPAAAGPGSAAAGPGLGPAAAGPGSAAAGPGLGPAAAKPGPAAGVALAVPGAGPLTLAAHTVLIGPEGGWTDAELAAVSHHVGLGPIFCEQRRPPWRPAFSLVPYEPD